MLFRYREAALLLHDYLCNLQSTSAKLLQLDFLHARRERWSVVGFLSIERDHPSIELVCLRQFLQSSRSANEAISDYTLRSPLSRRHQHLPLLSTSTTSEFRPRHSRTVPSAHSSSNTRLTLSSRHQSQLALFSSSGTPCNRYSSSRLTRLFELSEKEGGCLAQGRARSQETALDKFGLLFLRRSFFSTDFQGPFKIQE